MSCLLIVLAGAAQAAPNAQAREGVLDLKGYDFEATSSLYLAGQWAYYPAQLLDAPGGEAPPQFVDIPHRFDRDAGGKRPGEGFATYALHLSLPPSPEGEWGISLTSVSSAMRFYVNGELLVASGVVGRTSAEGRPSYRPGVYALPPSADGEYELWVQVSNFHHARGGFWEAVRLGPLQRLESQREAKVSLTLWLTSALTMMGIFHLLLWVMRYRDVTALAFALICAMIALRTLVVDDVYLLTLIDGVSWATVLRIEYLTLAGMGGAGWVFFRQLFPREFPWPWTLAGLLPCVVFAAITLLMPVYWFTGSLPLFHGWAFYTAATGPALILLAVRRRRQNAWVYLLTLSLFSLFMLHDTLVAMFGWLPVIQLAGGPFTLLPLGAVLVLLPQGVMLAARTARYSRELEQRSQELTEARDRLDEYSKALETRVLERTAALEAANAQLSKQARLDGLTGVGNRRHLDEQLAHHWEEHRQRQRSLALLLVDVDQFKPFNDRYGHLQGDDALRSVCDALAAIVTRPGDELARFGGEEIAALLPETDLEGARRVAERMREAVLALQIPHAGSEVGVVTVSIGVASHVPEPSPSDVGPLVFAADAALYRAKRGGRNRVEVDLETPSSDEPSPSA
ncbi:MAG: diguanylate cyclase [Pseudomonadota bacterium]